MATEGIEARGDEDEDESVHRLRDMVVEEVSLVDRAANKRRFLIVKRSDDMADEDKTELRPDGKGGPTARGVENAKKKPGARPADGAAMDEEKRKKPSDGEVTEKARRRDEDDDEDAEKARGPKDDDEDEAEAEKARRRNDDEDDEDTEKARNADDDEREDDEKVSRRKQDLTLPTPVKEAALRLLTEALERLMNVASRVKEAAESADGTSATLPTDIVTEVTAIAQLLGKLGTGSAPAAKASVAKAGARMAKDRLDRFQKAMALLADILKELTDSKEPAPAPTAGAAEVGMRKRDGGAAVPGLAELVTGIGELTRVVKRQEEELSRIRQARGVSNAIPVDGARRPAPDDVSWPFDMNRPITRDKVKKEVSFFDE